MLPKEPENADALLIRGFIVRAIAEYGASPAVPNILREIASKAPVAFVREAFSHLQSGFQSPGHRHLAALLATNPDTISLVISPTILPLEEAVIVAKRLIEVDSLFDVKLARQLPGRNSAGADFPEPVTERVLDIIHEISRGGRVVPILGHLAQHPNSRIAAKATLVLGRLIRNASWIGRHLRNPDFRIRANAVEALWGMDTSSAQEAFSAVLADPNNRVVGNAVVGLHLLQAADVAHCVNRMLKNGSPPFRWTAAWVMGRTARPEFADRLNGMLRDETPEVSNAASRALFEIRKASEFKQVQPHFSIA